jgi:hypothetical protein
MTGYAPEQGPVLSAILEPGPISFTGLLHEPRLEHSFKTHFVSFAEFERDVAWGGSSNSLSTLRAVRPRLLLSSPIAAPLAATATDKEAPMTSSHSATKPRRATTALGSCRRWAASVSAVAMLASLLGTTSVATAGRRAR